MEYIKGKFKKYIFRSDAGYVVGLFRVLESSLDLNNTTVTFTGTFVDLNENDTYIFNGEYIKHERYGYQFKVDSYERIEPENKSQVVEFLTSSFISGCGEKTALKIVGVLGDNAIKLIKEDKMSLLKAGISSKTADKIYNSIMEYYKYDELIMKFSSLGLSVKEISKIISLYGEKCKLIIENDIYSLIDYIPFEKLDRIFLNYHEKDDLLRVEACIIESIKRITFEKGDTYLERNEIVDYLNNIFEININDSFDEYIDSLTEQKRIVVNDNKYYLIDVYEDEEYIASSLYTISSKEESKLDNFENLIDDIEKMFNISYDFEQINAIREALKSNLTIITGGPGTGKTTIINGIIKMYQQINNLTNEETSKRIALLAPTGRAAKRMSEATFHPSSTIHRYLKWNKDTNEFGVNEYNPNKEKLIIVDEVSMIDNFVFASLLKGINKDVKLILVGDEYQLPSVSSGNILKDLIESDMFNHIRLEYIYRQSENSFIPILAKEIKNQDIESDLESKKDDYNFLICEKQNIKPMLNEIINKCIEKGLSEKDIQVLAPMYKGENGIDNLNYLLQNLFNPYNDDLDDITIGNVIYRVNDKIINLVNDVDNNVFNGDIGYITKINKNNSKELMHIDFYGNTVSISREEIGNIRHAYAMSIHKSQGSEFDHVIMPISNEYMRMLYNKLIYTGVSRAKKSLVMIGDPRSFMYAVNNSYSEIRKTSLKEKIIDTFNKTNLPF